MWARNFPPVECRLGVVPAIAGCGLCVVVMFLPGHTDSRSSVRQSQVGFVQGIVPSVSFLPCYTDSRPLIKQPQVGFGQGARNGKSRPGLGEKWHPQTYGIRMGKTGPACLARCQ